MSRLIASRLMTGRYLTLCEHLGSTLLAIAIVTLLSATATEALDLFKTVLPQDGSEAGLTGPAKEFTDVLDDKVQPFGNAILLGTVPTAAGVGAALAAAGSPKGNGIMIGAGFAAGGAGLANGGLE